MSFVGKAMSYAIEKVAVYTGPGPYEAHIPKNIAFFQKLNSLRKEKGLKPWEVVSICREELDSLKQPRNTLLVIPAGQSTHLDQAFKVEHIEFLRTFFLEGGRGFFTCGSAYWVCRKRIYEDICVQNPEQKVRLEKMSRLPLFSGVGRGPLCPFPGHKYHVGFYSEAIAIQNKEAFCHTLLSGGGSFLVDPEDSTTQVLATYAREELDRLQKDASLENAVILTRFGEGKAVLAMIHPYYDPQDFDPAVYQQMFPDAGTDWESLQKRLSPQEERMRFVFEKILSPLEQQSD